MKKLLPLLVLIAFLFSGCGNQSGNDPTTHGGTREPAESKSQLAMLGFYTISIDLSTGEFLIVPERVAQDIIMVVHFFIDDEDEKQNLTIDPATITVDLYEHTVGVDVLFTHPIPKSFFTGFDVRGIVFGPEVLNADGTTRWLNPVGGEGEGNMFLNIYAGYSSSYVNYVELDTGPFGWGTYYNYVPKGDSGYVFPISNEVGLEPGIIPLNYNIVFGDMTEQPGVINVEIVDKAAKPPPLYSHDITLNSQVIGIAAVHTFAEATCGVNIMKNFTPNEIETDCDEYRWVQVITTDAPLNGGSPYGYVDPHPSDDPPGQHKPFYWTDEESDEIEPTPGAGSSPAFGDGPRRPAGNIPPQNDPTLWHAELILVCVRWDGPDTFLHSEHYFFFKHKDGAVESGHYDGVDGGSKHARDVVSREFPDYEFN